MTTPTGYGVQTTSVERAVEGLAVGPISAHEARRTRDWQDAMDEYDAQFQVPISGKAGPKTRWANVDVDFGVTFIADPNRDSPYATPMFTFGVVTRGKAVVVAYVTSFSGGDEGFTGASVKIGIVNPGVKQPISFSGSVHLNFQGYGAPSGEEYVEEDEA